MSSPRKNYRYDWPKKAIKSQCPQCGHPKTFSRYVDTQTGEPLPELYGRCDRESNCGYFLSPYTKGPSGLSFAEESKDRDDIPKAWFVAAGKWKRTGTTEKGIIDTLQTMEGATPQQAERVAAYVFTHSTRSRQTSPPPIYSIPEEVFKASMGYYHKNQLAFLLTTRFGATLANVLLEKFQIGTSSRWPGACVFWYIDELGRKRGGQIKLFGEDWHTVKYVNAKGEKRSKTSWVHSALTYRLERDKKPLPDWLVDYSQKAERSPCLFGLPQLLASPIDKPVAIVEAPKTAIICSVYFPEFTWLAVGALSYLNAKRLGPLQGRKIMLFADLNGYELWSQRARLLASKGFDITMSDLLEEIATEEEREKGLDLADFLLRESQPLPPYLILNGQLVFGEVLAVDPSDRYPDEWNH